MTLELIEFARRFLLHVLPRRFVKIRYYGFLAQSQRATSLPRCRELITASAATRPESEEPTPDAPTETDAQPTAEPALCPNCRRGRLGSIALCHRTTPHNAYAAPVPNS